MDYLLSHDINLLDLYKKNLSEFEIYKQPSDVEKYSDYIYDINKNFKCPIKNGGDLNIHCYKNYFEITCEHKNINIKYYRLIDINIYNTYYILKDNIREYLYNIHSLILQYNLNNHTKDKTLSNDFETLKSNYLKSIKLYNQIKDIFDSQTTELNIINEKIFNLRISGGELYYQRKNLFENIKIDTNIFDDIKKNYFKDNITEGLLKNISKKYSVDINDIRNLVKWFDLSKEYFKNMAELSDLNNLYDKLSNNFKIINNNFILKNSYIQYEHDDNSDTKVINIDKKKLETSDDDFTKNEKYKSIKKIKLKK